MDDLLRVSTGMIWDSELELYETTLFSLSLSASVFLFLFLYIRYTQKH